MTEVFHGPVRGSCIATGGVEPHLINSEVTVIYATYKVSNATGD